MVNVFKLINKRKKDYGLNAEQTRRLFAIATNPPEFITSLEGYITYQAKLMGEENKSITENKLLENVEYVYGWETRYPLASFLLED